MRTPYGRVSWGIIGCVLVSGCAASSDAGGLAGSDRSDGGDGAHPDDAVAAPIMGGLEAWEHPEAVLVNMKQGGSYASSCSGALVAPRVVLTAGHCVHGYDGWEIVAPYAPSYTKAQADKAVVYDWTHDGAYVAAHQHDVGLVVLATPVVLDVYPVLAAQKLADGTKVRNVGRIESGQFHTKKLFVGEAVAVMDGKKYGYPYDYATKEIIESGDSGGPVVRDGATPHEIVAVNSGAGGGIQILARVDLLHAWLGEQIAASEGGASSPPSDPCGGIGWEGTCDGAVLSWCESDELKSIDCGKSGWQCGWDAKNRFYNCL
jgi:hypothetical protein